MKRILALLLAVGMVVGAQAFRNRIVDPSGNQADPSGPGGGGEEVLVCDPGLEEVCERIAETADVDAEIQAPAAVADGLADPTGEGLRGAWITLEPWVGMAALRRQSAGETALLGEPIPLARSPLVVAVWEDRADVLEARCGALTWRCVGDASAGSWSDIGGPDAWGPVKPGRPDDIRTAEGVLVLGQLAAGYFDGSGVDRADVEGAGFFTWFTRLEDARPSLPPGAASPIAAMVAFTAATLDIAAVLEAQAAPFLARTAARAPTLRLRAIEPVVTADLVVAAIGDDDGARTLTTEVAELAPALLAEAGWRVEGQPRASALEQVGVDLPGGLPPDAGLPPAGTLLALLELAQEVGR